MDADGRARKLATRWEGIISAAQLQACGLTRRQIRLRVARGELVRLHPDVFLVGGAALSFRARVRAALVACGPTAFASHWTATVLWRIRRQEPQTIDITVVGAGRRHLAGVRVHRLPNGVDDQLRDRGGLRVSSPARAICELSACAALPDVQYAIQEAAARSLLRPDELRIAVNRWGARPGAVMLRAILQADGNGEFSRSWAERRLRRIIDRATLPRPVQNTHVLGHRVDALWPEQRLVVEVDGIATHGTAVAFAADRAMDAELVAAGWRVLRFTALQLRDEPLLVATRIAQALALAA